MDDEKAQQLAVQAYEAKLPQNQMPHDYCKVEHAPAWALRTDGRYWIPLATRKNAQKYFSDYRVALYSFVDQKWTFELQTNTNEDSWWVIDETNFACIIEADDPNVAKYYLAANAEEERALAFVCVPARSCEDVTMIWSEFETQCLFSRMKMLCLPNKERPVPDVWKNTSVALYKLAPQSQSALHKECIRLILGQMHAKDFKAMENSHEMFFLTSTCPETQSFRIAAFAIGKYCSAGRIDKHWKTTVLVSCEPEFHMAHRLLNLIEQTLAIPCFPGSVENQPYWETHAQYLVDSAIECIGWDFQDFLEMEVDGFFNLLPYFHMHHNFFM